jgi:hypothetical protein
VRFRKIGFFAAMVCLALEASTPPAYALMNHWLLSGVGGLSLGYGSASKGINSASALIGGELTCGLESGLSIGAFFDHNFFTSTLNNTSASPLNFYGAVVRLGFWPASQLFVDGKIGLDSGNGSNTGVGAGVGAGYAFPFTPFFELRPRVGFRVMSAPYGNATYTWTMYDFGVMASLSL